MPPEPRRSSTLYLPMVKRRHLPRRNCSAWKCVRMPSRTRIPASLPGSAVRFPPARSPFMWVSRRFSSTTPLLRTNSRNSSFVEGAAIQLTFQGRQPAPCLRRPTKRQSNGNPGHVPKVSTSEVYLYGSQTPDKFGLIEPIKCDEHRH